MSMLGWFNEKFDFYILIGCILTIDYSCTIINSRLVKFFNHRSSTQSTLSFPFMDIFCFLPKKLFLNMSPLFATLVLFLTFLPL